MPPVKGGAVENLVHLMIENNETKKAVDFTVFSCCNETAEKESSKYKNSKFVYVKNHLKLRKIANLFNRIIRKLFKNGGPQIHPFLPEIIKEIKKRNFDYILLENWPDYAPSLIKKMPDSSYSAYAQ